MAVRVAPAAGRPRPTGSFELYSWYFMRISGIVLVGLVLGHVAIMHVFGSVEDVNSTFVAQRMATPFWRTWDLMMVLLALLHGVNGARWVLDDCVHRPGSRLIAFSLLYTVAFTFLVLGTLVLLTYQPPTPASAGAFSVMR